MHIQTTCAQATCSQCSPYFSTLPRCPSCGESVVAARASEFIDTGRIRHLWVCDGCTQAFSTVVTLD